MFRTIHLKYVERRLRKLSRPGPAALDLTATRQDLERLLERVSPDDPEAEERVFRYLDACVSEFRRSMLQHHEAGLTRLELLEQRVKPRMAKIRTLMDDELTRVELLDAVIANLTLHAADPEKPIRYTGERKKPKERHR